ncbi:HNH endonuclease [Rhizobium leguminosarum]|uniref:HNH endonuclease n=1 Tax=Rhizobium leguminosarum TaxID=384 RepID=UPI001427D441
MGFDEATLERFWSKVDRAGGPDACWPWKRTTHNGYGTARIRGRNYRAHRLALMASTAKFNPLPSDFACHHCDNPRCCNPTHLYWGDAKLNRADCMNRSRAAIPFGSQPPRNTKLTDEDVKNIKHRLKAGSSVSGLAREFGVVRSAIQRIKSGRGWQHIAA